MINEREKAMVSKSKKITVFAFTVLLITIWVILFRHENRTWDFTASLLLASGILPITWTLLEKKNNKLNLGIMLLVLLGIAWLIWVWNTPILIALPLLTLAMIAVKWTLSNKTKPARLLGFFVKTLTLFLIGTGIAYFIWLNITAPITFSVYSISTLLEMGMIFIVPISLLLEAISIIIYGIFRIKLKTWEIFLSSWYASTFASTFVVFAIWAPRAPSSPYSSIASAIGEALMLLFQSLFIAGIIAGILTIIYATRKEPTKEPPP